MSYILPIFFASLLGSPHCVAMCGGFATIGGSGRRSLLGTSLYHIGRLVTYLLGGVLAFSMGEALTKSAAVVGVQQGAHYIIGTILVISGLFVFVPFLSEKGPFSAPHRGMAVMYRNFVGRFSKQSTFFPLVLGIASTLLPCGWLYLYIAVAAQSSSPMVVMLVFWLGTLPLLTAWSSFSSFLLARMGRYFPILRALCLVLSGVLSLLQHSSITGQSVEKAPTCHQQG